MSTPSDEERLARIFGPIPSVNDAPSPARSPPHSHGSITPPPKRSSSPVMTLSSHIAPRYAAPSYSPTKGLSLDTVQECRPSPPRRRTSHREQQLSSPENSDSERRSRRQHRAPSDRQQAVLEIRQPQQTSQEDAPQPSRSHDVSPSRGAGAGALTREMKESISRIVRGALKPHWHSKRLTAEQYEAINRDISRRLYEEVSVPEIDEDMQKGWERLASQEVARAVASLQA